MTETMTVRDLYRAVEDNNQQRLQALLSEHNISSDTARTVLYETLSSIEPSVYARLDRELNETGHADLMIQVARANRFDIIEHAVDNDWLRPEQSTAFVSHILVSVDTVRSDDQVELSNRVGKQVSEWDESNPGDAFEQLLAKEVDLSQLPDLLQSVASETEKAIKAALQHTSPEAIRALSDHTDLTAHDLVESGDLSMVSRQKPFHAESDQLYEALLESFDWDEVDLSPVIDDWLEVIQPDRNIKQALKQFLQSDYATRSHRSTLRNYLHELLETESEQLSSFETGRQQALIEVGVKPQGGDYDALRVVIEHGTPEQVEHWLEHSDHHLRAADMKRLVEASAQQPGLAELGIEHYDASPSQVRLALKRYAKRYINPTLNNPDQHELNRSTLFELADDPGPDGSVLSCTLSGVAEADIDDQSTTWARVDSLISTALRVSGPPEPDRRETCWDGLLKAVDEASLNLTDGTGEAVARSLLDCRVLPTEEQLDELSDSSPRNYKTLLQHLPGRARKARSVRSKEDVS